MAEKPDWNRQFAWIHNLHDAVIVTDMAFVIRQWNAGAERLYGWPAAAVIGRPVVDVIRTQFLRETRDTAVETLLQQAFYQGEVVEFRRDGSPLSNWVSISLFKDDAGQPLAAVGINRDITGRKQTEQELQIRLNLETLITRLAVDFINLPGQAVNQAIDQALQALAEFATATRSSVFLFHDDLTRVTNTHEWCADPADSQKAQVQNLPVREMQLTMMQFMAGETVTVTNRANLAHMPWAQAWMARHGFRSLVFVPMFNQGELYGAIGFYGPPGEEIVWSEVFVTMLTFVASIVVNALERKRSEDRLEAYAAELKRSNEELQEFASIASHDLQEPLRKIQAFGSRLRTLYADRLDDRGRDYMDRMERSAERMRELLDDLLLYSRLQTRPQALAPVNLNAVLSGVLSDLENQIDRVNGRVQSDPLPTITADATQMRQLFQNLISNGLKFHRPGVPPVVTIRAQTLTRDGQEIVEIRVQDNGIGFEDEYSERIFGVFQRLHGRTEFEGSGLGLAICRKIVHRHHGRITAHGTPGAGATFTLQLPLRQMVV